MADWAWVRDVVSHRFIHHITIVTCNESVFYVKSFLTTTVPFYRFEPDNQKAKPTTEYNTDLQRTPYILPLQFRFDMRHFHTEP